MHYPDTVLTTENIRYHTYPGCYKVESIPERIIYRGKTKEEVLNLIDFFSDIEFNRKRII